MKIWYDVSGIYSWRGNFTGIQRIVYNLGKKLASSDHNVGFFIFDSNGFKEVSFDDLEERLKALNSADKSKKQKTVLSRSKIQHYSVVMIKNRFKGTKLEPYARSVYNQARASYRKARGWKIVYPSDIFQKDDLVIVVDGNWQFSGYEETLIAAKNKNNFRLIHFVHDLVAVKNPSIVSKGAQKIIGDYFKKILNHVDTIITISESTKRDINWFIGEYGITANPDIFVLILGDNIPFNQVSKPKSVSGDFILSVSTIEIRKNYAALYYAYKLAIQKGIELPHLVIVGRKGWMAEETFGLLTEDPELKRFVTILTHVNDAELEWLYQNCTFTVFPSFYEGWGLPVAESLAHGKCCVSSNTSSMPEVGGDLVTYVSPYDPSEILNKISGLSDKKARHDQENLIRKKYVPRTWDQTYHDFEGIVKSLMVTDE